MYRALFPLLLLAGCGKQPDATSDLDRLDRELTDPNSAGNTRDPAVAAALADPIMVDPALVRSSNAHAIRPPDQPPTGAVPPALPLTDPVADGSVPAAPAARADCPDCKARQAARTAGALGELQRDAATAGCAARVGYSAAWANRLPSSLPLYPGAQVGEAAGTDADGCRLRIVSFVTGAAPAKAVGFYHARARKAGFSAEVQQDGRMQVVGGTRGHAAFVVYATPRPGGGSSVDLVVNGG
jgi:hypothetical protein